MMAVVEGRAKLCARVVAQRIQIDATYFSSVRTLVRVEVKSTEKASLNTVKERAVVAQRFQIDAT
jgi:hypothetical protein